VRVSSSSLFPYTTLFRSVPPRIMGIGPVEASKKALARAGLTLSDIDVIEINEAFAAQVLSCLRGLELPFDDSRVNMNGGAIAIRSEEHTSELQSPDHLVC